MIYSYHSQCIAFHPKQVMSFMVWKTYQKDRAFLCITMELFLQTTFTFCLGSFSGRKDFVCQQLIILSFVYQVRTCSLVFQHPGFTQPVAGFGEIYMYQTFKTAFKRKDCFQTSKLKAGRCRRANRVEYPVFQVEGH